MLINVDITRSTGAKRVERLGGTGKGGVELFYYRWQTRKGGERQTCNKAKEHLVFLILC